MSLAHNGHSQLSDSNTGEAQGWKWNGLSPLGKQVIAEMNRVGIMIDVSHPSKESMMQTLALTKAPIIASHSSVRKLANHSRNLDDEQLLALKKNGGVMQTVAFSSYVKIAPTRRNATRRSTRCARSSACPRARRSAAAEGGRAAARGRGGGGPGAPPARRRPRRRRIPCARRPRRSAAARPLAAAQRRAGARAAAGAATRSRR